MRTEPRQPLLVGQRNLVACDLLGTQPFRDFFEMACEYGDPLADMLFAHSGRDSATRMSSWMRCRREVIAGDSFASAELLLHSSPSMLPQRDLTKSAKVAGYGFEGRGTRIPRSGLVQAM